MSWRDRLDLGTSIVGHVYDAMKVTDHWSIDFKRGFTWWAEDFAQTVQSDIGMFHNAQAVFRVTAETDLLKGRGRAQAFEVALTSAMREASFSSVYYDSTRDVYKMHTSVYAHSDNEEWIDKLFMCACALQIDSAHKLGHELAKKLQATPASSAHPDHGIRSQPDPILGVTESYFKPLGEPLSQWIGKPEWREMEWAMERQSQSFTSDHQSCLRAEFPWSVPLPGGAPVSVLEVTTDEPHPILGHGLMFRLKLPVRFEAHKMAHCALELNSLERTEWLRSHFLGSWCCDNGILEFECFVPNVCYHSAVLESLSLGMAIRAEWVDNKFQEWFRSAPRAQGASTG
jgi:hypothetical protein